jgi:hypothetical protein
MDVFACGIESGATVILHYDGSAWSEMGRYGRTVSYVRKIWGSSGQDVYVLGLYAQPILHYDGTTWSSVTLEGAGRIWDIWGRSRDDVYAATDSGTLHYDGSTWRSLDLGTVGMRLLWGTRTEVFGTGEGGVYHLCLR